MSFKKILLYFICCLLIWQQQVYALSIGGWKPLKTIEKVVTAPTKTVINAVEVVIGEKKLDEILDPTKEVVKSAAPIPAVVADVATWPQNEIYKEARKLAAQTGTGGEFIFDVATFYNNYQVEMTKASGQIATNTLLGQNPLQIIAMPLAAALREARERHIGNAKPLPEDVKIALANIYSKEVLDRARYVVGNVELTLPNGIGKVHKFMGKEIGVVADDVIIFSSDPKGFWDNPFWWGHELKHVEQYLKWGVEEFAFRYVKNYRGEVENPADDGGETAVAWALKNQNKYNMTMSAMASQIHVSQIVENSQPLISASDIKDMVQSKDPVVVQMVFPNDLPTLEYYGTASGKIIVKDNSKNIWMQIGWAIPPDILGPAWVYHIPNRVRYDVFSNGAIMMRYSAYGTPVQVGYVIGIKP